MHSPTKPIMHSTLTSATLESLARTVAFGNIQVDSDLNRGSDGSVVWSEKRRRAFIAAKVLGHPSQNITFVRISDDPAPHLANPLTAFSETKLGYPPVDDSWCGGGDGLGRWKVLDGRNRLKALLHHYESTTSAEIGAMQITCELLTVPEEATHRLPQIFISLNNGGVSLTPGEALHMTSAPTLCPAGRDCALDFARRVWDTIQLGRTSVTHPHTDESIVANSLWKIRDAIHGPGSWQGQPTLITEHSELFGEGGRKDREMGFSQILELIQLALYGILGHGDVMTHPRSTSVWHDVALVFGQMSKNVMTLGDYASMLALGSGCTNVRRDKGWLPASCVLDLLIQKSLPSDDASWWCYFLAFLQRCKDDSSLWIQCIAPAQYRTHGTPSERRAIAIRFAAFARKNCVAVSGRSNSPKMSRSTRTDSVIHALRTAGVVTDHTKWHYSDCGRGVCE